MNYIKTLMVGVPLAGTALLGANSCSQSAKNDPKIEQYVAYSPSYGLESIDYQRKPQIDTVYIDRKDVYNLHDSISKIVKNIAKLKK